MKANKPVITHSHSATDRATALRQNLFTVCDRIDAGDGDVIVLMKENPVGRIVLDAEHEAHRRRASLRQAISQRLHRSPGYAISACVEGAANS